MKDSQLELDQHRLLLSTSYAPRASFIVWSVIGHLVVLILSAISWPRARVLEVKPKLEAAQMISGSPHVAFAPATPKQIKSRPSQLHFDRARQRHALQPEPESEGTAMQALRKRAKEYTNGLMSSIKFRHIYGFSPGPDYQLAFQTEGALPVISASEVPPRFEQYLIVDIIVDVDGHVADAQIEGGAVNPAIEKKVLAAIREFKYRPATRDGSPIPCQLGIVVHIPS
jgi:TonB family protein